MIDLLIIVAYRLINIVSKETVPAWSAKGYGAFVYRIPSIEQTTRFKRFNVIKWSESISVSFDG